MKTSLVLSALFALTLATPLTAAYDGRTHRHESRAYGKVNRLSPAVVVVVNEVKVTGQGGSGAAIGAIVGGVFANKGFRNKGDAGRAAGTVGGAVIGGVIGRTVERTVRPSSRSVEVLYRTEAGAVFSVVQAYSGLYEGQSVWVSRTSDGATRVYAR